MLTLKIRKVGNSLGLVLPREALERLQASIGANLYITQAPDGGYRLTPYDPEFAKQMTIAEEGMRGYRNTLRALAE